MSGFYLLTLASLVAAAPQRSYNDVQILRYNYDNRGDGQYRYAYEQSDGQRQESQGEIRNPGTDNEYLAVSGVYAWVAPNGVRYTVTYVADDQGFQPEIEEESAGAPTRPPPPSSLPARLPPPYSPPPYSPPTYSPPTPRPSPPPPPTSPPCGHLVASCLG